MKQLVYQYRWLLLVALAAFLVRLYHFNTPLADWHSWRQADTASVTREYVKHGIDLLKPQYHDLSDIPSGKKNLEGYRMVEFPFVNAAVALTVSTFGLPLVQTSRFSSIIFSVGTLLSLYFLVKNISDARTALLSAVVFAFMPYSIYYGRVILPEPAMLFFSTFSLMSFVLWLNKPHLGWYLLSLGSLALALLLKPFVLFLAPVYGVLALLYFKKKIWYLPSLLLYVGTSMMPFLWWREYIAQFPEGIPASSWLFNSNLIRLRPAWFRWLGWERISKLFLGIFGVLVLPFNLLIFKKDTLIYGAWWLGCIAYFIVIATGNVQHDYYQNLIIPIISISVARGSLKLYELLSHKTSSAVAVMVVTLILVSGWYAAWQQVKDFFQINHWEYIKAGKVVDELTPPDALVIAPVFGNTVFLFQTNRTGWPIGFRVDEFISQGAQYYITTYKDDEANDLKARFTTIQETKDYLFLDLRQSLATPSGKPL